MKGILITPTLTQIETESFKQYLKEISKIKQLTQEEENICTQKAFSGDKEAINELIVKNLRFVVSVAKQYMNNNVTLEDLINEGNIGLCIAAKKFDPNKGVKFISYAVWWIQKIIVEHLNNNSRTIRLPINKINDLSDFNKKINKLEQKLGRAVDIDEIIDEYPTEFESKDIEYLSFLNTFKIDSMDAEHGEEGESYSLHDILYDKETSTSIEDAIDFNDNKNYIETILSDLKPRNRQVILCLFGLYGERQMSLQEVGDELGISREMVRQIKEKTITLIKNRLKINNV